MLYSDKLQLDKQLTAYDIVTYGQNIGIDYIDVVEYMKKAGISNDSINTCFSLYTGKDIIVTN